MKRNWNEIIMDFVPLLAHYIRISIRDRIRRKKIAFIKKVSAFFLEILGFLYFTFGMSILISYYAGAIWVGFVAVGIILIAIGWIIAGSRRSFH